MKNKYFVLLLPFLFAACKGQGKTDLSKLRLDEPITDIVNFSDRKNIGTDNIEYPFALLLNVEDTTRFTFEGVELKAGVIFHIVSRLNNDSIARQGGGHFEIRNFDSKEQLQEILGSYHAENRIYGYRIKAESSEVKSKLKKALEKKYGPGTPNPNTDNGLYWNIKQEHKYVFFAPDYDRLIVLNSTDLSKTCYWDLQNGVVDFGGCNREEYFKSLGVQVE